MEEFFQNLERWDALLSSKEQHLQAQIHALESEYLTSESSEEVMQ